jgi:hypothetical protein
MTNRPDPKTPPAEIGGRVELFATEVPAGTPAVH